MTMDSVTVQRRDTLKGPPLRILSLGTLFHILFMYGGVFFFFFFG